jgi:tripartite-type tricarboxylate transporter receptor subunit TctC
MLSAAAACSATAALPRVAAADWRPTETVRIIVPAAAGGSTDVMGRLLAQQLQVAWGQNAIESLGRRRHHRHQRGRAPEG